VTGALALAAGAALLALGALRVAALLASRSTASFLLAAYVVAWTELVLVVWALSRFGWVTRWWLLGALAVVGVALAFDKRGWSDVVVRLRDGVAALREGLGEPVVAVLARCRSRCSTRTPPAGSSWRRSRSPAQRGASPSALARLPGASPESRSRRLCSPR
jgi:hypothetical protein